MKKSLSDDDHLLNVIGGCNSSPKHIVVGDVSYKTVKKLGRHCENYSPVPNISLPATKMCGNCLHFHIDNKTNKNYCSLKIK